MPSCGPTWNEKPAAWGQWVYILWSEVYDDVAPLRHSIWLLCPYLLTSSVAYLLTPMLLSINIGRSCFSCTIVFDWCSLFSKQTSNSSIKYSWGTKETTNAISTDQMLRLIKYPHFRSLQVKLWQRGGPLQIIYKMLYCIPEHTYENIREQNVIFMCFS